MSGLAFVRWMKVAGVVLCLSGIASAQSFGTGVPIETSAFAPAPGVATFTRNTGLPNSGFATISNDLGYAQLSNSYASNSYVGDAYAGNALDAPPQFASQDLMSTSGGNGYFPKGRVILEGFLFSKPGVGDHPLILDDVNPIGDPLVTSDDLSIDGEVGTQVSVEQQSFYLSYMTTGSNNTTLESQSDPADINWFAASDADPSDRYFTVYTSVLRMGDIGIRRQADAGTDVYLGFAIGRLKETMDLLSSFDPKTGFYSYAENEFYGAHLGVRRQFFNNGNYRIEGMARGGLYFNSMEVNAVAEDFDGYWHDDSIAYSGMGNVSVIIPAWPVNFRIGYQLMLLGGVITPQEASRTLDSFDLSAGEIETGEVFYHGLTFGIEKLW